MTVCGSKGDCDLKFESVAIEVLADIVGLGILTSFIVTSVAAFLLIIFAYFKDSLPGDYMTWADLGFLQDFHLCKQCRKRFKAIIELRTFGEEAVCKHTNLHLDTRRRNAVGAFLLTLSDQQLVVGPAMIIAALAQRCSISCYEFRIIKSLASLASVAHLSTVLGLRNYLAANPFVRNIRVAGMCINLCLLVYTMLVSNACYTVDISARVHCVMSGRGLLAGQDFIQLFGVFYVIFTYYSSLSTLYQHDFNKTSLRAYCCSGMRPKRLTPNEFEQWYEQSISRSVLNPGSEKWRLVFWERAMHNEKALFPLLRWLRIYTIVSLDSLGSFLHEIPKIMFSFAYGITSVIVSRANKPEILGSTDVMEFGQIVPLFLVLIPILAGIEAYHEARGDDNSVNSVASYFLDIPFRAPRIIRKIGFKYTVPSNIPANPTQPKSSFRPSIVSVSQGVTTGSSEEIEPTNDPRHSATSCAIVELPIGKHDQPRQPNDFDLTELERHLMIVYSWKITKKFLMYMFVMGTALSIYAGVLIPAYHGELTVAIILVMPFITWFVSSHSHRYIATIRLYTMSRRKARTLMKSLAGAGESERAEILKSPPAAGEIPVLRTKLEVDSQLSIDKLEANATASTSEEGIELTQPTQARLRANVRSSNVDDELDENDMRFRRADTEWNMGR